MNQPALLQAGESGASWPVSVPTIPSRSRLYRLEPRGRGTVLTESLTSYLNRLAWRHQVAPQRLVAQEIGPRLPQPLAPQQVASFSWSSAMGVNGNGPLARAWATLLEDLTTCTDLRLLTLAPWVGDLQPAKLLRARPAWCAACYVEWKDEQLPLYEPLIWTLQVVSLCMRHARPLEDQCPACQRKQSVIRSHTRLGQCAYCQTWLGAVAPREADPSPETLEWQTWVWQALEELRCAGTPSELISWEPFFQQLRSGCATRGEQSRLADLAGLARGQLAVWLRRTHTPTFKSVLEFCYVCNMTPLQVLTGDLVPLKRVLQAGTPCRVPPPRRPYRAVNQERCRTRIEAILDGQEEPLGYVQLAAQLGYSSTALRYHFPQECARLSQQIKEYRRQRKEQRAAHARDEIRHAALALHAQGVYPSQNKVGEMLSNPSVFLQPEARATLHGLWQELGWDRANFVAP
jgi:hypothetical protein